MKKTLMIAALAATLLAVPLSSHAEDISPTGGPRKQWKKEAKELRNENKTERQEIRKENKLEREKFRGDKKELLKDKTPEERLTLIPSIKADRKKLMESNANQLSTFRQSVQTKWQNLWGSIFGKK